VKGDYTQYIQANRENILRDIASIVAVRSVRDEALEGAPYGAGVNAARDLAMQMCRDAGFDEVVTFDDRIAYAHYGDTERFLGVIAHVDVVPEGSGWFEDPFTLSFKDGYMVGRGVGDDKGPFILALWAMKYLIENKVPLNYGLRLFIGLDEEQGMSDLLYYVANGGKIPLFSFTPDAGFPVCHGEKGLYGADIVSGEITQGNLINLAGGVAHNVVPDYAAAELPLSLLDTLGEAAKSRADITLTAKKDSVVVVAKGVSAHASVPEDGVNANLVLLRYLLSAGALGKEESEAAEFLCECLEKTDGSQFGIDCDDGLFTPLTIIGGVIAKRGNELWLNVDSRYPTNIDGDVITANIRKVCEKRGFRVENAEASKPFYIKPDSPAIRLLCDTWNAYSGREDKPFVISGGTYARYMPNAVSFGIEREDVKNPDWVGGPHMKNEAVNIDLAMMSCEIFIEVLTGLQQISFD